MGGFLFRLGGLTARHRIAVIVVWIGLAALALGLVKAYGAKTDNGLTLPGTDSQAAFDILAQRFPPQLEIDRVRHVLEPDDRHRPIEDRIGPA